MRTRGIGLLALCCTVLACNSGDSQEGDQPAEVASQVQAQHVSAESAPSQLAPASATCGAGSSCSESAKRGAGACGDSAAKSACGSAKAGSCTDKGASATKGKSCGGLCSETAGAIVSKQVRERKDANGEVVRAAGAALSGATKVEVASLLKDASAYVGKKVSVQGNVSAMCHHRRSWFGIANPEEQGTKMLRILAAPQFLVPRGAVGAKATAEGVVEVLERTGSGGSVLKIVVLRAIGAEFR